MHAWDGGFLFIWLCPIRVYHNFVIFHREGVYDIKENMRVVQCMKIKKYTVILALVLVLLTGCTVEKTDSKKQNDIEFTVMDTDEIPEELKTMIEEGKQGPFKLTYGDKGYLYIAEGYGKQKTSGYSIEVNEVYETENAVYLKTSLIGPKKGEKILKNATYPYVVVKIEYNEKHVVFE